jgi:hypothetical protein
MHTPYLCLQVQAAGSLRGTDRSRRLAETDGAAFAAADAAAIDLSSQAGSNPWETGGRRDLGACDKCNVAVCQGGCKCDSNCDCRPSLGGEMRCTTTGSWVTRDCHRSWQFRDSHTSVSYTHLTGSKCDKCNIPQADGGCKCDQNCDCLSGTCGESLAVYLPRKSVRLSGPHC